MHKGNLSDGLCLFIAGQGADELWQALRGHSISKLAIENRSMRPHLKVCIDVHCMIYVSLY